MDTPRRNTIVPARGRAGAEPNPWFTFAGIVPVRVPSGRQADIPYTCHLAEPGKLTELGDAQIRSSYRVSCTVCTGFFLSACSGYGYLHQHP